MKRGGGGSNLYNHMTYSLIKYNLVNTLSELPFILDQAAW